MEVCNFCKTKCAFTGVTVADWQKYAKETGWRSFLEKGKKLRCCPNCAKKENFIEVDPHYLP